MLGLSGHLAEVKKGWFRRTMTSRTRRSSTALRPIRSAAEGYGIGAGCRAGIPWRNG
ncbi:hypothetical protein [Micromonospora sp. NPDC023644]|uniref:hypothetical protein n=1 Tax=Micromonospora sp. NPDC023644 TaxID=3154321 RepID=UPI0033F41DEB